MATQLISDMTGPWDPLAYENRFVSAVQDLVRQKVKAGDTQTVTPLEDASAAAPSNVVDLTELLARSLAGRKGGAPKAAPAKKAAPARRRA